MSNVRDIEKIIDEAHKGHAILKLHKKTCIPNTVCKSFAVIICQRFLAFLILAFLSFYLFQFGEYVEVDIFVSPPINVRISISLSPT